MKTKMLLILSLSLLLVGFSMAQVPADQDTIVIEGGTANMGNLETVINGDTTATGERINPNRVYKLRKNTIYYQYARIDVYNPTGTVSIVGETGGKKPIIILTPMGESVPSGNAKIYGSLTLKNVYAHQKITNGETNWTAWAINEDNQTLRVEDCVMEFCEGKVFECKGVKIGLKIIVKNTYFRDMENADQWWDSRAISAEVPADSIILENVTVSNSGLTFLTEEVPLNYFYMNHCTIINSKKAPLPNAYYEDAYITNNLFINCQWTGEDINTYGGGGHDPDALLTGIINVDTLEASIYADPSLMPAIEETKIFIADNLHWVSRLLDPYYNGEYNNDPNANYPLSHLEEVVPGFVEVENVPTIWMNERTMNLIDGNANNMVRQDNYANTTDPGLNTPGIANSDVVDRMATWNRIQYGVAAEGEIFEGVNWVFGDYDPMTVPGIETEVGDGITQISDLLEDFRYTADIVSHIDGRPLGALHWDPAQIATWDSDAEAANVKAKYEDAVTAVDPDLVAQPMDYSLGNAYPNPFNPTTTINYSVGNNEHIILTIYNALGQKVKTLVNRNQPAGNYSVQWNALDDNNQILSSGIYFYTLKSGSFTKVKKMVLLK